MYTESRSKDHMRIGCASAALLFDKSRNIYSSRGPTVSIITLHDLTRQSNMPELEPLVCATNSITWRCCRSSIANTRSQQSGSVPLHSGCCGALHKIMSLRRARYCHSRRPGKGQVKTAKRSAATIAAERPISLGGGSRTSRRRPDSDRIPL